MKYIGDSFSPEEITSRRRYLEHAELLKGRPDRQAIINKDDMIDLLVALHKTETVDDFIKKVS